ncbi:MAG: hypothetical protein WC544_02125 [Patescibacteria group bacterium]
MRTVLGRPVAYWISVGVMLLGAFIALIAGQGGMALAVLLCGIGIAVLFSRRRKP